MFDSVTRHFSLKGEDKETILGVGMDAMPTSTPAQQSDVIDTSDDIEEIGDYTLAQNESDDDFNIDNEIVEDESEVITDDDEISVNLDDMPDMDDDDDVQEI